MKFVVRSIIFRLMLLCCAGVQSGCYVMQAATGQMSLLSKREPLAKVISDPQTSDSIRQRLILLREAREFASRELGLPNNGSYRSYVDLKRDYVVWNVFATEPYSIKAQQWCFPIAGCVVYRGYFDEKAAQRYARNRRLGGEDATVAGAAAYSTLGHFDDPILSTMLRSRDVQVIGTLFHELAHQVVYVPGDSTFNESFAMTVEEAGLQKWLSIHREHVADELRRQLARQRSQQFTELLLATRTRLDRLYTSGASEQAMAWQKPLEFGRLKFEYWQLRDSWQGYTGYDAWFDRALNNADLVPIATYDGCVPGFKRLLKQVDNNLNVFYARVRELAMKATERAEICAVR